MRYGLERLGDVPALRFSTESEFQQEVSSRLSATRGAPVTCHPIGESEQGRPLVAYAMGSGPVKVSLVAGAHSDEPVGPETLRLLVRTAISNPERITGLLTNCTLAVIPHINPDGEARNRTWIMRWPRVEAYLAHAFRELPGRDLEFGYPGMRVENAAVSAFLRSHAPFSLHMSLHGMGFSDGALLLIERHWIDRTKQLQSDFRDLAKANELRLHDHDRGGDKGFIYIGPGFTTTPEGGAMREHFSLLGDEEMASRFHSSSMEFVRSLGEDPLCLVTELPLFCIRNRPDVEASGVPETYLRFKQALPEAKLTATQGESIEAFVAEYGLEPVPVPQAIRMQLATIDYGLRTVD